MRVAPRRGAVRGSKLADEAKGGPPGIATMERRCWRPEMTVAEVVAVRPRAPRPRWRRPGATGGCGSGEGGSGGDHNVSAPILTIYNQHTAACGAPPALSNESGDLYIGYFANRYGEQWIFTFDRATREARLRGGDADWGSAHVVRDGRVEGLILDPGEAAWLQACWSAASA